MTEWTTTHQWVGVRPPKNSDRVFRGEYADTHAQPRPFSPEVSRKMNRAAIALEQRKKYPNGE